MCHRGATAATLRLLLPARPQSRRFVLVVLPSVNLEFPLAPLAHLLTLRMSLPQVPQPSNVLGVFGLSIRTQDRDLHDYFGANGRRVEKALVVYDQRVRSRSDSQPRPLPG